MSVTYIPQPSSSVMSIGAITSPCSSDLDLTDTNISSRKSSIDISYGPEYQQFSSTLCYSSERKIKSTENSEADFKTCINKKQESPNNMCQSKYNMEYSPNRSYSIPSPSASMSSGSDQDSEYITSQFSSHQISSNAWIQPLFIKDNRNKGQINGANFPDHPEDQLNNFDLFFNKNESEKANKASTLSEDLNYSYPYNSQNIRSSNRKSDALSVRRARNKLASAKYRAKKQALTHAMQDRIMQLATQVMVLRDELQQTKKNEYELKVKYDKLVEYCQSSTKYSEFESKSNEHIKIKSTF